MSTMTPAISPPQTLRVVDVDPLRDPRWGAFVERHPNALVYQHPAWLRTLQLEYPSRLIGLACASGTGELRGVLALSLTRGLPLGGRIAGRRLSSLPRTPVAGPLALDETAAATLLAAAKDRAAAAEAQLQLKVAHRLHPSITAGLQEVMWRPTFVLDLSGDGGIDGRQRRRNQWAVNKARKSGVRVTTAHDETQLRAWYRLYLGTMRWLAVPSRCYRLFQAAWRNLRPRGMLRLVIAELDGEMIAGSLFLMRGSTVFYAFTGWDRAHHSLRANDLVHWQAIDDFRREGFRDYDFGEVAGGQDSLAAFKSKWGAQARALYRYHYPSADHGDGHALESGHLGGLAASVWRRVPLAMTAAIGDLLYRRL